MRMWLVDPSTMCRQHLLGAHVELHMLAGSILKGRSIQGFLDRGLLEPTLIREHHTDLVAEMTRRGMKHRSELPDVDVSGFTAGHVDRDASERELRRRCSKCRGMV